MTKLPLPSCMHIAHVVAFVGWNALFIYWNAAPRFEGDAEEEGDPFQKYGKLFVYFSITVRLLAIVVVPQLVLLSLGLLLFDVKRPSNVALKCSVADAPFFSIRIVTRGLYPTLVSQNVRSHLQVLEELGITNFIVEVVTDNKLVLDVGGWHKHNVKQIVVPSTFETPAGTMNKARALQYCLQGEVNILKDEDWVIHLDEETKITENSMKGILNFISSNEHQFGQGVITYAAQPRLNFGNWWVSLQNRLCTVADSVRVADDLGKHKAQFKLFHRPYFGIKGSFVVAKFAAERKVGWDFGPPGSKAEDAWMSLVAIDKNFTFDFIDGDMLERSPFTFADFFKQRKRWMQGIFMVVTTPTITLPTRLLLACSLTAWLVLPFSTMALVLQLAFPFNLPHRWMDIVLSWLAATGFYMYFIGYMRQFPIHRFSWLRTFALIIPEIVVASVVSVIVENLAVIFMWFGDWYGFYVVQKEVLDMKANCPGLAGPKKGSANSAARMNLVRIV